MAIKQLEDGRWQADVTLAGGKRARRIFNIKSEAVAFEASLEKQKYDAKLVRVGLQVERYSMGQAIRDFELSKRSLRLGSFKRLQPIFRQFRLFVGACGITSVDDFTPDHATWFFNEVIGEKPDPKGNTTRLMTPRPKTVNAYIQTVRALFKDEVAKGHITRNPFLHIKNQSNDPVRPEYYSRDELRRFFAQPMPDAYRAAFLALLHTGMRFGELAHLRWDDVRFESGFIHVRSRDTFRTKTRSSERAIPMNATMRALLGKMSISPLSDTLVFCSQHGEPLRERLLIYFCKKISKAAGISTRAYLHKFRHTFASHLVQRGVPLESIKQLLGHSSIKQTEMYAHNESDHLQEEVIALDRILE